MTPARDYPVQVFWSDEDGGYIALATDLEGCSAFGESEEDALREIRFAIEAWIDAARAAGNPVPFPSQPGREPKASGRVLLRLPRSLHEALIRGAQREGTSLNQYAVYLLSSQVARAEIRQSVAKFLTWPSTLFSTATQDYSIGRNVPVLWWSITATTEPGLVSPSLNARTLDFVVTSPAQAASLVEEHQAVRAS